MRTILLLGLSWFLLLCGAAANATEPAATATTTAPRELRVLFVGNSLVYVNNLPATLRALAAAQAVPVRITTATFAAPGGTVAERWKDGHAAAALRGGTWDAIVLQERGGLLACMVDPDQRTSADCRASDAAHRAFARAAKTAGARVLLMSTNNTRRVRGACGASCADSGSAMQARNNVASHRIIEASTVVGAKRSAMPAQCRMRRVARGLDHVEPARESRKRRHALEEDLRRAHQACALACVHRRRTPAERIARAITHFDEDDAIAVAHHQVDLAEAATGVRRDVLQTRAQQVSAGRAFHFRAARAAIDGAPSQRAHRGDVAVSGRRHPSTAPGRRR